MKTIKNGDEGIEVRVAQLLLKHDKQDGIFDQTLKARVNNWQAAHKLACDGIIGPDTWASIAANAPMVSTSHNKKTQAAKALQLLLGVDADGIFGPKSRLALKAYQTDKKLTADGVCGPKTWKMILGVVTSVDNFAIACENLKQFDKPHGTMIYGPDSSYSTYGNGGCGVTSFAIVQRAYGLAPKDETATQTIQRLGKYAWQHGYRPKGNGTSSGLFSTNGTKATSTRSASAIENALRNGQLVILLIKNGFDNGYTGSGLR